MPAMAALLQPHAALANEFDPGLFQHLSDHDQVLRGHGGHVVNALGALDCHRRDRRRQFSVQQRSPKKHTKPALI
jgi:hypothetical protein